GWVEGAELDRRDLSGEELGGQAADDGAQRESASAETRVDHQPARSWCGAQDGQCVRCDVEVAGPAALDRYFTDSRQDATELLDPTAKPREVGRRVGVTFIDPRVATRGGRGPQPAQVVDQPAPDVEPEEGAVLPVAPKEQSQVAERVEREIVIRGAPAREVQP